MRTHTLGARAASPRSPMTAAACRREERPMGEVTRVKSAFSLLFKGTRIEAAVPPRKPLAKLPAVWSTSAVCLAMIAGLAAAQENRTITLKELCLPSGPTQTVVPQGNLALESSLCTYETGSVYFLSVLSNFTMVLDYEMNYYDEALNYALALSRLEQMTGQALTD